MTIEHEEPGPEPEPQPEPLPAHVEHAEDVEIPSGETPEEPSSLEAEE